jgi:transcription termination/antitermination protein NusG
MSTDNICTIFERDFKASIAAPISGLPQEYVESRWYAAYTSPRHEKWVAGQMDECRIESFLPTYRSVRRWKDRRKQLDLPLFPGYVFVRIPLKDRLQVLRLPGVVQFVTFQGKPAALPEREIEALRHGTRDHADLAPHPYLKAGRKVRICSGPMAGIEGILTRRKDCFRVVIAIELIMRSVALEVDITDVELLH